MIEDKNKDESLDEGNDVSGIDLEVIGSLVSTGDIDPNSNVQANEVADQINKILIDHKTQFEIFLVALCRSRLTRMTRLLKFLEMAEDEIFTEDRLADASTSEILRMISTTNNQVKQIMEFVKNTIDLNVVGDVGDLNLNFFESGVGSDEKRVGISASERERIRTLYSSMFARLKNDGNREST